MKYHKTSWLVAFQIALLMFPNAGNAKTVDFRVFTEACPALKTQLTNGETKINALKLSDSKLLRVQLEQYLKISNAKASGSDCRKIQNFFKEQVGLTKAALRVRADTTAARAKQMQAQVNQFVADMQTLQVVLDSASTAIANQSAETGNQQQRKAQEAQQKAAANAQRQAASAAQQQAEFRARQQAQERANQEAAARYQQQQAQKQAERARQLEAERAKKQNADIYWHGDPSHCHPRTGSAPQCEQRHLH